MTPARNRAELRIALVQIIADVIPGADASRVPEDADLRETLDIDSMDFLRLVQRLHDALGIDVPESDYRRLATLDRALAYLADRSRPQPGGPGDPPESA